MGSRVKPGPTAGPETLRPSSYAEMAELVRDAEASRRPLVPVGLGNHLGAIDPLPDGAALLSLERLQKVLRYEPGDFTIGVQAGMPLDALRAVLAENGQELPVDFAPSPRGTVGGALAQNRFGPRRSRHGTLRQYLIGVSGLRGGGRIYRAGGMVVKNVAGYDVMKLLVGSRGALGPVLEANFKLRPIPRASRARLAQCRSPGDAWALARAIRVRALEPAVLSVLDPQAALGLAGALGRSGGGETPAVLWSFEGNPGAVDWLEREVDSILAERPGADIASLGGDEYRRALDFLTSAREVDSAERERTLLFSLAALPSEGPGAAEALGKALGHRGGSWVVSDAAGGIHLARAALGDARQGADSAGKILERLAGVAKRLSGVGRVLAAPSGLLGSRRRAGASADPADLVSERIHAAFDPRGVFGPSPAAGAAP